ncbi:hypothetical protein VVDAL79087_03985 [Vibrio vulnificus]|nr:hypothetical protein VVDAL79087_03985 [Vibrio vulnificus]
MLSYHQLAMHALGWIPACARMTSKRRKRQANEHVWDGIEYFCLQKACRTTDANSAQIRFHYRATPTIAVILANAGIHLPARTEHGVGKSTHSGKHLQTQKQRPPLSSFSRTRESIYSRAPSSALGKVLTATNIPNAERAR